MPGRSHSDPLPEGDAALAALAAELRRDVDHLATAIGERNVSRRPEELAVAADWLCEQFRQMGYAPQRQVYAVAGVECCNLDAELPGTAQLGQIVVVGAHYDSVVGTPGANDNATGVAAMLALARRFAGTRVGRTLRFVAFVNEEPPYFQTEQMGSWVYAQRCRQRKEQIVAMLSLETIGFYDDRPDTQSYPPPFGMLYPRRGNFVAMVGNTSSADLVRRVVGVFRRQEPFPCEGGAFPAAIPGIGFSDQWSFWQEGYPGVMVTDTALFRYPHYHEPTDTTDKVDFDRLGRVTRGLIRVVRDLAEGPMP